MPEFWHVKLIVKGKIIITHTIKSKLFNFIDDTLICAMSKVCYQIHSPLLP